MTAREKINREQPQFSKVWRKSNPQPRFAYTFNGVTVSGRNETEARKTYNKMVRMGMVA